MTDFRVDTDRCLSCGACVRDCPHGCLRMDEYPVLADERQCLRCQHCLAVCPTGVISIFGRDPAASVPLEGRLPAPSALDALMRGRRSVRSYKQENVDPVLLREVLESAAHAPTGGNKRKLVVSVVDDVAVRDAFREEVYRRLARLVAEGAMPRTPRPAFFLKAAEQWAREGRDDIFRNAPHFILVANGNDVNTVHDPVIYLSYFELMAQARGIGTVWCGLLCWALLYVMPDLLPRLGIPETHTLGYAMLFGYPDVTYRRTVQHEPYPITHVRPQLST